MKKRHVMRALVAAATALALTACGSTGSSDTSKSTSTASAASTSSGSEAGTENTITIPAGESVSQDSDVTAMVAVDFTTMDPMDTSDTLSGQSFPSLPDFLCCPSRKTGAWRLDNV